MSRTDRLCAVFRHAALSCVALLALASGATAATLEVKVSDASGQPLSGAAVTLIPSNRQATSGRDGVARFDNVAPGAYDVSARYPGLAPSRSEVTVGEGSELTIAGKRWVISKVQAGPGAENGFVELAAAP